LLGLAGTQLDATAVVQSCTLLYRGFLIRWAWCARAALPMTTSCRIQFGDTADFKFALQAFAAGSRLVAVPSCARMVASAHAPGTAGGIFLFSIGNGSGLTSGMSRLEQQFDRFLRQQPRLGQGVYIAKSAIVFGDVKLGSHSSVWYHAVLRGDINRIVVGHHTNIQDNAVLHISDHHPCILGNRVTVGHSAIVHACKVGDEVLVGMGAVILDGAIVGRQSLIGAKALVTQGMKIPPGSLVLGAPAKVVRPLTARERSRLKLFAAKYAKYAAYCLKHGINVGEPLPT
jgi:gamma-carbonic anhydrase